RIGIHQLYTLAIVGRAQTIAVPLTSPGVCAISRVLSPHRGYSVHTATCDDFSDTCAVSSEAGGLSSCHRDGLSTPSCPKPP
ncbi:hypothetical protein RRG08_015189, partial [Elysia crispata]